MANEYSQIQPELQPTVDMGKFRFWCQKVLPLVYDDSISYYEVLGKMVVYLNQVIDNINADTANVITLKDAFEELQDYVAQVIQYDIHDLEEAVATAVQAAEDAETSATNAGTSEDNAHDSEVSAAESATIATNKANQASTSAENAATASTSAQGYAQSANASAINASQSSLTAITMSEQASANAQTAQQAADAAEDSEESAEADALKAEGLAVGQQNGVDVGSSSPYYHKNAKYYAEQAGQGAGALPLSELPDTHIVSPTNGQILAYDSSESKWVNSDDVQGVTSLENLTDTTISSPSGGQVLMYDDATDKWVNSEECEVAISSSTPSNPDTKVWINETAQTPVSIATTADLDALDTRVDGVDSTISGMQTTIAGKANTTDVATSLATKQDKVVVVTQSAPTAITLADNREYYFTNVSNLTLAFPSDNFECWIHIVTSAASVTITMPSGTKYIGNTPVFGTEETWELSVKNGVVVAGKVV